MTYDDFLFYLPAFGSFAFIGISAVLSWVLWRLISARLKRKPPVEKPPKPL
jgi:hypothetical protein